MNRRSCSSLCSYALSQTQAKALADEESKYSCATCSSAVHLRPALRIASFSNFSSAGMRLQFKIFQIARQQQVTEGKRKQALESTIKNYRAIIADKVITNKIEEGSVVTLAERYQPYDEINAKGFEGLRLLTDTINAKWFEGLPHDAEFSDTVFYGGLSVSRVRYDHLRQALYVRVKIHPQYQVGIATVAGISIVCMVGWLCILDGPSYHAEDDWIFLLCSLPNNNKQ